MELSPQSVSSTTFKIVKKGYDPEQVKSYLSDLAASIEVTQNQASAMEARARAAIARLQELSSQTSAAPEHPAEPAPAVVSPDAENISRTLLLAQRTADATVNDAQAEAERLTADAQREAQSLVDGAQEIVNRLIEESKVEARRAAEGQRVQVESEVQALLARRDFLVSDVEHLEQHIVTQRERLHDVAAVLTDIVAKVPGGLGDVRRPLISAVTDESSQEETPSEDTATDTSQNDIGAHATGAADGGSDPAQAGDDGVADVDLADRHGSASAQLGAGEDATLPMVMPHQSDTLVPMVTPKPVVLTPIAEPGIDPIWVGRSGEQAGAEPSLLDGLDAITEELPTTRVAPTKDPTILGDELA